MAAAKRRSSARRDAPAARGTAEARGAAAPEAGEALVITRVFDAPRELVWKAWTDPEYITRWWGPRGFTAPVARIDLRVGGTFLSCMRSPDGQEIWGTGVFREIVPPERLVFSDSFADEHGNAVPASHYGFAGEWPLEMQIEVTLEEEGGRTKVTLRHIGMPAAETAGAGAGWNESFDKLAASLAAPAI